MADESLTVFLKLFAAGFYGISSFLIVVINKSVLTSYGYVYVTRNNVALSRMQFTFSAGYLVTVVSYNVMHFLLFLV